MKEIRAFSDQAESLFRVLQSKKSRKTKRHREKEEVQQKRESGASLDFFFLLSLFLRQAIHLFSFSLLFSQDAPPDLRARRTRRVDGSIEQQQPSTGGEDCEPKCSSSSFHRRLIAVVVVAAWPAEAQSPPRLSSAAARAAPLARARRRSGGHGHVSFSSKKEGSESERRQRASA